MAAEIVASAIVGLLVEKIASGAVQAFQQMAGLEEEVERLNNTLLMIHALLQDAEAKQLKEKTIQLWLKRLKDVAYDLDDLLDEMMTAAVAGHSMAEREGSTSNKKSRFALLSFPKYIAKSYNSFQSSQKFSSMIAAIQNKLDAIADDKTRYSLNPTIVVDEGNHRGILERKETGPTPNVTGSMFYGRDEDLKRIVDFLMDDTVDGWPQVISIFGIGGLGKTTLAQTAFNTVREHFDNAMWACVSDDDVRKFDVKRVANKIIESAGRQQIFGLSASMDTIERYLKQIVEGQRFLLVLDDVWNANHIGWGMLKSLFARGSRGSKIIVTTRSEKVAKVFSPEAAYRLQGLPLDDSRNVFESRAFATGCAATRTMLLESIGTDIVKKCDGLPLAAEALGSMMYFKKDVPEWEMVRDSEIWQLQLLDDMPEILPSLRLSFNHLPARLKSCFAYCSIIPKHYKMEARILVRLWMAEGLVPMQDGSSPMDAEDLGYQYLDELISRSFIQDGIRKMVFVDSRHVKMHDVMHDLARSIAGDECSTIDPVAKRNIAANTRFALINSEASLDDIAWVAMQFRRATALRSLYQGNTFHHSAGGDGQQEEILDAVFELKRLRALHLTSRRVGKLPVVEIGNLKHLRYLNLDLSNANIEELTSCIGDLFNLQTLILRFASGVCSLPESMGRLYNLSYLDLCGCRQLNTLPESIGDLINLRHLNLSYCTELKSLPESIGDNLINLQHLDLSFCFCMIQLPESISRMSNLRVLGLVCCSRLTKLPADMKNMKGLVHVCNQGCGELNRMPQGIGSLARLQTLRMFSLDSDSGSSRIGELGGLKCLEGELSIYNLREVRDGAEAREARLQEKQGLRKLTLSWGWDELDDHEQQRQQMVDGGGVLDGLRPPTEITELRIDGFVTVTSLPGWMTDPVFSNLWALSLEDLDRCETIPALGRLPSLSDLEICSLGAIRRIGPEFYGERGSFPVLKQLRLYYLTSLEEWTGGAISGDVADVDMDSSPPPPLFPSLVSLFVRDCPELRALPFSSYPALRQLFPLLTTLSLEVCPRAESIASNISQAIEVGGNLKLVLR